jgi:hypothetical protein
MQLTETGVAEMNIQIMQSHRLLFWKKHEELTPDFLTYFMNIHEKRLLVSAPVWSRIFNVFQL